ncbi:MAG TPA: hypothetical protein PK156_33480 [Polyangium sp.]|nr:hypothetical protein [Polyangium sp.]
MSSLYLLVEGSETEPALYNAWLPLLLPGSKRLARPEDAASTSGFYLLAGYGYPSILQRVQIAVDDITKFPGFGRLVVALDSEDRTVDEAAEEMRQEIAKCNCPVSTSVVVAQCCVESWLLGNHKFVKRNPVTDDLCAFRGEYDVVQFDPELMPNARRSHCNTRAQYHEAYLKAAYKEHGLKFTKSRPGPALEEHYLKALLERAAREENPKHLRTFATMVEIFSAG